MGSASCGYADLTGAIFSDTTILSELAPTVFYGFYSGVSGAGYITDASMNNPEACEAYCHGEPTCSTFYYQYEFTNSSRMVRASIAPRWMHKCQLNLPFAANCGSPFMGCRDARMAQHSTVQRTPKKKPEKTAS